MHSAIQKIHKSASKIQQLLAMIYRYVASMLETFVLIEVMHLYPISCSHGIQLIPGRIKF